MLSSSAAFSGGDFGAIGLHYHPFGEILRRPENRVTVDPGGPIAGNL